MTTTAQALPVHQTRIAHHTHCLLAVVVWEARRWRAGRVFWISALLAFGGFFLLIRATQTGSGSYGDIGKSFNLTIPRASVYALLTAFLPQLLFLFGMLLPFVNADGVARDLKRRTHELMMTTSIATWAYVWGRYLSCLLASLGLALLLLAALLLGGLTDHLQDAALPFLPIGTTVASWAAMTLPFTVFLSSVCFALGAWLPRRTALLKIGVVAVWFLGNALPRGGQISAQPSWNPLTIETSSLLYNQGIASTDIFQKATSEAEFQKAMTLLYNQLPDLGTWLVPHLAWAAVGLALVLLAAFTFQRFRNTPN